MTSLMISPWPLAVLAMFLDHSCFRNPASLVLVQGFMWFRHCQAILMKQGSAC
jgi:hypothetical protein